jgi:hypothetical protein
LLQGPACAAVRLRPRTATAVHALIAILS